MINFISHDSELQNLQGLPYLHETIRVMSMYQCHIRCYGPDTINTSVAFNCIKKIECLIEVIVMLLLSLSLL